MDSRNNYKDERNPLLQPVVASDIATAARATPRITTKKAFIFLTSFLLPLIIFSRYGTWFRPGLPRHEDNSQKNEAPLIPFPTCPNCKYVVTYKNKFFNPRSFYIHEKITASDIKSKVHIARGEVDQEADIIVQVQVESMTIEDFARIRMLQTETGLSVTSLEDHSDSKTSACETCTYVIIIVYVKPHYLLWDSFRASTFASSIELAHNAEFETFHFFLSSIKGDIARAKAFDYVTHQYIAAHAMQVFTQTGAIFGDWALGSDLTIHSATGHVKIDLRPFQWSSGPRTAGNINVTSTSGNIDIHMPFIPRPSARKYMISISSISGSITGEMMHGSETNLTTNSGSIDVVLLPYKVYPDHHSQIRSYSNKGDTRLQVLEPVKDTYYTGLVMNETVSLHEVTHGKLWLQYPSEWSGTLQGETGKGIIDLRGSFDEKDSVCDGNDTGFWHTKLSRRRTVCARRGLGGSELKFKIGRGNADLLIGTTFVLE
jgi:hypothetical protein